MSFAAWYVGSLIVLILIAGYVGRSAVIPSLGRKSSLGILIDGRERFSLNRLQLVMWTLLILATLIALFGSCLVQGGDYTNAFDIGEVLLGLMGISAGSATVAGAVKDGKDTDPTVQSQIARGGAPHPFARQAPTLTAGTAAATRAVALEEAGNVTPHWRQIFLEEMGQNSEVVVNVSKFQNLIFTVILGIVYVTMTLNTGAYPEFNDKVLWLLGISHAGYVGGKVPNKA